MGTTIARAKMEFKRSSLYVPREVPRDTLEWPALRQRPTEPTKPGWMSFLYPMLVGLGYPLIMLMTGNDLSETSILPGLLMALSMGMMPILQWIGYRRSQRQYQEALRQRKEEFQQALVHLEQKAHALARRQQQVLEDRYPSLPLILQIALDPKARAKRLWERESGDEDFLTIRVGVGEGKPSFSFQNIPNFQPEDEEFEHFLRNFVKRWSDIPDIPVIIPLLQLGSVVFRGRRDILDLVLYRVILDLAVHHSPRSLRIGVLANNHRKASQRWGWMRWLPHTRVLEEPEPSFLAFTVDEGYRLLDHVGERLEWVKPEDDRHPGAQEAMAPHETIVLIVDDEGVFRRTQTMQQLIEHGGQVRVYLIFVNEPVLRGVHGEVRLYGDGRFVYKAEIVKSGVDSGRETIRREGKAEPLSVDKAEEVARALLQLEPPEPRAALSQLPETVLLADMLHRVYEQMRDDLGLSVEEEALPAREAAAVLSSEKVGALWRSFLPLLGENAESDDEADVKPSLTLWRYLLHFPLGLTLERGKIQPLYLNLLPEGSQWDGYAAYHSILIGPTGSGKSEFLKTLIWGGAYLYPPGLFNVFFLDFKGGAAVEELKYREQRDGQIFEENLPHLVGLVTNPQSSDPNISARAISQRGIYAIQLEISRREKLITQKGKSQNIWEYNQAVLIARRGETEKGIDPTLPLLPHLLIILDEFSKAISDFPELAGILDDLVRRGRSLGVYLLLANQTVTPVVSRLMPNVGWRIGLRLQGEHLREVIRSGLPDLTRVGQGYVLCVPDGRVSLFQSAWGGAPLREGAAQMTWHIYEIEPEGRSKKPFVFSLTSKDSKHSHNAQEQASEWTQGRYLTQIIYQLVRKHPEFYPSPRQLYLEPLSPHIDFTNLLNEPLAFREEEALWEPVSDISQSMMAPLGLMDNLEAVRYDPVSFPFHQGAGHLWVLGTATSGKELVVETALLSLAWRYTPEQVWFYILDSGGVLQYLEDLPHTGAYISPSNRERFYRFVYFLQQEYNKRKFMPGARIPRLLIVLHNFHRRDLLETGEQALALIEEILKNGRTLGIHLLITSSTPTAFREEDASGLSPRIVLDMGKPELFWEAGLARKHFFELTRKARGRGYWVARLGGPGREMQVAEYPQSRALIAKMNAAWQGERPPALVPMPKCLGWDQWVEAWQGMYPNLPWWRTGFPAGIDFEHRPFTVPLGPDASSWAVFASPQRGKTNLLLIWARAALQHEEPWTVWYFAAKQPPSQWLPEHEHLHMYAGSEEVLRAGWQSLTAMLRAGQDAFHLLLIDDAHDLLKALPASEAEAIVTARKRGALAWMLAFRSSNLSRLSSALFGHPFQEVLQTLKEERHIFLLSPSPEYLVDFNLSPRDIQRKNRAVWEALQAAPRGRGILLLPDKQIVLQIPYRIPCEKKE